MSKNKSGHKTVALDLGNGFAVACDGNSIGSVKSAISEVPSLLNRRSGVGFVTYNGQHYHCGNSAYNYPTYTNFAVSNKEDIPIELSVVVSLYAVAPFIRNSEGDIVEIKLKLQVPSKGQYAHKLSSALKGLHVFALDDKEYKVLIDLEPEVLEGYGSYILASVSDPLEKGMTLVVDVGAGTVCTLLIDNKDDSVVHGQSFREFGVVKLASMIAQDYDLMLSNDGRPPHITDILSGLENKTYCVGEVGTDFKPYFNKYLRPYWKLVIQEWNGVYRQWLNTRINRFVVTGGGGELLREMIESVDDPRGRVWFVPQYPLFANVQGMMINE